MTSDLTNTALSEHPQPEHPQPKELTMTPPLPLNTLKSGLYLGLVLLIIMLSSVRPATASLDEADQKQVQELIENYILQNPQIIRDAIAALEIREEAARLTAALDLVRQDGDDPVMGNPEGDITIYEFSDYNCGYCKRLFATLMEVLDEDDQVRLVIKEFPILAESSVLAARAGIAAHNQGHFDSFHRSMMTAGGRIDERLIRRAARQAGVDMDRFDADMESSRTTELLRTTMLAAQQLDIRGTPALVIGDRLVPGAISKSEIMALINELRDAKNR